MVQILFEDNHVVAVYKPAGVLVQGDISQDENLLDQTKEYLKEKYKKPGNVFLGLVHRLDRPVAGIVLFAKTSKGAARLSEQFRDHTVQKIYHAVVIGQIKPVKGALIHNLKKDEQQKKAFVDDNGDRAELIYDTVRSKDKFSLLKIEIKTGRFHQIRAQLSASGHPIVGDVKYGAPAPLSDKSIALAATEITFQTATSNEEKTLSIDLPESWQEFV